MSIRSKSKPVKSGEEKSWFGKFKNVFYTSKTIELPPKQKRTYHKATHDQILKMFEKRKQHPTLTVGEIAKIVGVNEAVCQYWLEQDLNDVLANIKAQKGRKKAEKERRERVRIAEEKREKKRLRKLKKKAKPTKPQSKQPTTVTFASPENEKEISLSTFAQLSNIQGKKILNEIKKEDKYPTHQKASPKWKGALPVQIVATDEEWEQEDTNYKIGKATMAKAIVAKKKADAQSKKEEAIKEKRRELHKQGLNEKGKPLKIHTDDCPSCNPNSSLTLKEYQTVVFLVYKEMQKYAQKNAKVEKQLAERAKQLVEMEKESLGNVAERAKEGHKLCIKCDKPIDYSQASRCIAYSESWGVGNWYCADHEPPVPKKGAKNE